MFEKFKKLKLEHLVLLLAIPTVFTLLFIAKKESVVLMVGDRVVLFPVITSTFWVLVITLTLLLFILPIAVTEYRRYRLVSAIEAQIPTVSRILADALNAGLTISKAFEMVSMSNVGPISLVMNRALTLSRINNEPVTASLIRIAHSLESMELIKFAVILDSAVKSGSRVDEILYMTSRIGEIIDEYRRERKARTSPYVSLVYAILITYILISSIVIYGLLPILGKVEIPKMTIPGVETPIVVSTLPSELAQACIQYIGIVQSVVSGLIIGRSVYDKPKSGLIHSVFLISILTIMNYLIMPEVIKLMFPGSTTI